MAAPTELAELKKAVEELGQKMDKQMVMVQGLIDLFASTASKPNLGLIKESPQPHHIPAVGTKLCSRDMFKDLVELHEAMTHSKEDVDSLFKTTAKGEDVFSPEDKRMHPVEERIWCNCKANKGSVVDSKCTRPSPPRTFSCFSTPLTSVYEKLLHAGSIKPLDPTPLPKNPSANFKLDLYCAYHQMPGHATNACYRLRHAIQDLIDHGIITTVGINQIQNAQSFRARTQPRNFSVFEAPLSAVMEKLVKSGHLKPLAPTAPPKVLPTGYNPSLFCAFHQMPGHPTEKCYRLRHEIQDLIDNGIIQAPPPSEPNVISNPLPQRKSDPLAGRISINSTQINPSSTIFNLSHYIVPETQPKPTVPIPSEAEFGMLAIGSGIENGAEARKVLVADQIDQAEGRTDSQRIIDQGSTE